MGGGGGGGYTVTQKNSVVPGDKLNISIGSSASNTIFNNSITAKGGCNGLNPNGSKRIYSWDSVKDYWPFGGNGGSAGGNGVCRIYDMEDIYFPAGNGGSDGSSTSSSREVKHNGYMTQYGQGSTTRAFGESDGTLYAGGGGGSSNYYFELGKGGDGGGGNGGYDGLYGAGGGLNTGGGGGGGGDSAVGSGGKGGSGIAIIRWGY